MAWLDDHPPRTQQFRCPRRERPSGVIGVHTAESFPDETGPDDGAENVADFIRRRSNYGSYHYLADSDSIVHLIRLGCVAYHIATHGLNEHSIGISAATQAHKWDQLDPQWVDATIRNMARAAARAARWLKDEYGITVPARQISLAQARRKEPGFIAHADADPDRRTDPGSSFPWSTFLAYYADEMDGDDMPTANENAEAVWGRPNNVNDLLPGHMIRKTYEAVDDPKVLLESIGRTDDVLRSPSTYEHNETNPHWFLERFLREIWDMVHAVLEAQDGVDEQAIMDRLDRIQTDLEARLDTATAERGQILDLMRQHADGSLDAAEVVARMGELLTGEGA